MTLTGAARVVRVLPDLTGLDRAFDYLVPDGVEARLGDRVRIDLHGRRAGGWVVAVDPDDAIDVARMRRLAKVSSRGPSGDVIELARWAAWRWAAGRIRTFLVAASPPSNVVSLPPPRSSGPAGGPVDERADALVAAGGGMLRLPPNEDQLPALMAATVRGRTLVVVGGADRARTLGVALRRRGLTVAIMPGDWAAAAAGVDVVIGTRRAAWAPCPGLAAAVIVDEHDEALQEERNPTWHARDVVVERARRQGAPVLALSPVPTVSGIDAVHRRLARPSVDTERASWPIVEVVDRSDDEPWKTSLLTSPLIAHLRSESTVVCIHNTPGRARILACRNCRSLVRCESCEAAVRMADDTTLRCPRCANERPAVCQECGASAFANLRPGVTRLREELEAAAGRPAVAVTGATTGRPQRSGVYVGTEAALHRVDAADVVAFLDIDHELLAPRYRANEQTMTLLVRAARLIGPRASGGRILLQTFLARHDVIQAALMADPGRIVSGEAARRKVLGLPPFAGLAAISGVGADEFAGSLRVRPDVVVGGTAGDALVKAPDWAVLADALAETPRPKGARLRIEVDPPRR